jgi:hypothetical protein
VIDTPFAKEAKEIVQAIRGKGGQEDMQSVIDSIESQAASYGIEEPLLQMLLSPPSVSLAPNLCPISCLVSNDAKTVSLHWALGPPPRGTKSSHL